MNLIQRILNRRLHYRHTFAPDNQSARFVLADLRRFCKPDQPPMVRGLDGHTDQYATGVAAGRAEVFWRIAHHLNLNDADLFKLKETLDDNE